MRLNGKMNKTQPMIIGALAIVGVLSFQNCSQVGITDLASQNEKLVQDLGEDIPLNVDGPQDMGGVPTPVTQTPDPQMPGNQNPPPTTQPPKDDGDDMPAPQNPQPPVVGQPPVVTPPPVVVPSPTPNPVSDPEPVETCQKAANLGLVKQTGQFQTVACLLDPTQRCVVVCHNPSGKQKNAKTKLVRASGALKAHLGHGDTLGACDQQNQEEVICEDEADHDDDHGHHPEKQPGKKQQSSQEHGKKDQSSHSHGGGACNS